MNKPLTSAIFRRHIRALPQYDHQALPIWRFVRTAALIVGLALFTALYGAFISVYIQFYPLGPTIPVIALALLVIWALPDARTAPIRLLTGLFFTFFVVAFVWPDYLAITLPGMPWITVRRLIAIPLTITLLICISVNRSFREELGKTFGASRTISILFLIFVVLQIVTIPMSEDIGMSIQKFIVAQLYWTAIFVAGCYVFRKPGRVELWAALFCLILVPLTIYGFWEWRQSRVPWAGHIPSFLAIEDELVQKILAGSARSATGIYRVQSAFTTSLTYAEFMALTIPFLIHFVVGNFRLVVRLSALIGLPVILFMINVTDSRLGMVGFLLSILLYPGLLMALKWKRDTTSIFGPAFTLAYPIGFGLVIASTFIFRRMERMVWGGGEHQASTEARREQYRMGFEILAKNPFGHGIGRGGLVLGYTNPAGYGTIDTYYLLIALEYGVLGFFVYYAMLALSAGQAVERLMTAETLDREQLFLIPLSISMIVFIVIKSVLSQEGNHTVVFMMMAAILALLSRTPKRVQPRLVEDG